MQIGHKTIGVMVVALGGLIAGAYTLGKRADSTATAAMLPTALPTALAVPENPMSLVPAGVIKPMATVPAANAAPAANVQAPAGHPPVAEGGAPPTAGKVEIDPKAKFVHFRVGNRNVKDILSEGSVVWVGTSGGVVRYDTKTDEYKLFDSRSGLLSNGVFHVSRLNGKLAVGTYGGGLSLLDEKSGKWETFNIPDGLGDAFVYDVVKTKSGDVWIATWSGVNRVRGGDLRDRSKWELHTVESTKGGLPNDWVYGLAEGKDGVMWLATEGGLARFAGGKWDNWNHAKGLGADYELVKKDQAFKNDPAKVSSHHARQKQEMGLQGVDSAYNPNYIVSLVVDRAGVVWAGTWGGGVARFDGKRWTNLTVADGLAGNIVYSIAQHSDGAFWFGTNRGVSRWDGKRWQNFGRAEGLLEDNVYALAVTPQGEVWAGTRRGVTRFAR